MKYILPGFCDHQEKSPQKGPEHIWDFAHANSVYLIILLGYFKGVIANLMTLTLHLY